MYLLVRLSRQFTVRQRMLFTFCLQRANEVCNERYDLSIGGGLKVAPEANPINIVAVI